MKPGADVIRASEIAAIRALRVRRIEQDAVARRRESQDADVRAAASRDVLHATHQGWQDALRDDRLDLASLAVWPAVAAMAMRESERCTNEAIVAQGRGEEALRAFAQASVLARRADETADLLETATRRRQDEKAAAALAEMLQSRRTSP